MKTQPTNPTRTDPSRKPPAPEAEARPDAPASTPAGGPQRLLIGDLCTVLETYLEPRDVADVYRAYLFSAEAHTGQSRRSGEPYIYHPIAVLHILATMRLDARTLSAAILHDVIEDTGTAKEKLAEEFGADVAGLVDGVSKITRIETVSSQEEAQAENFRKMLLAMASDIRVILIKLADRLHNMRTIERCVPARRRDRLRDLDIYAPIANRLGVRAFAMRTARPGLRAISRRYATACSPKAVKTPACQPHRCHRRKDHGIAAATVNPPRQERRGRGNRAREARVQHLPEDARTKHLSFSQVLDIFGFRVIVKVKPTCYRALGVLHSLYKPVPGQLQGLYRHPQGERLPVAAHDGVRAVRCVHRVQIRTHEMHRVAGAGVASHWLYKGGDGDPLPHLRVPVAQGPARHPAESRQPARISGTPEG